MKTNGHPNCLRIALLFFVLTFALCICAVSAQERPARSAKAFTAVTAGYLALSAEDFYLSNRCIQAGACVEVGSYRGVASHPLAFAVVKMGASSALAATAWSIRKSHPKAAWGVLVGLTVAQSAVVVWNSQQGRVR
jgi:fermentation-respiration switch protein FrsA (DUF1100 family)